MKYLLSIIVVFIISGCSQPYLTQNKNSLTINNNNHSFNIEIKNKKQYKFNRATTNSFVLNESDFHLEYIQLKRSYDWTGLADGFYQNFLKKYIKNIKKTSTETIGRADVYTYSKDDKYFYLVALYDTNSNTFIIDYTGDISSKILNENKYISKSEQFKLRFNKSLLDDDIIENYFEKETSGKRTLIITP